MICSNHDKDLLLMAHGELSPWRGLILQKHLRRCSRCKAKQARLLLASRVFAEAIQPEDAPPWTPGPRRIPSQQALVVIALILTLTAFLWLWSAYRTVENSGMAGTASTQKTSVSPSGGCAPNLPNDRCH